MFIYWIIWFFICIVTFFVGSANKKNISKISKRSLVNGKYSRQSSNNITLSKLLFFILMLFFVVFIGFRHKVGGDWGNYILIYNSYKYASFYESLFISDIGYSIINYYSQLLGFSSIYFVNFICSLILCFFLILSFRVLREYWLLILIYYPYHIVSVSLGYTRQSVALAILIYSFTFLMERKLYRYLFFTLLSALFHSTTVIFLLLFPVAFITKKKLLYVYQVLSVIIISISLYLGSKFESSIYFNSEIVHSSGVFMRLTMHCLPLVMYFNYRPKLKQEHRFPNNSYNFYSYTCVACVGSKKNISNSIFILDYFAMLVVYCCVLAVFFSTLADRFNLYLIFFDLFILSKVCPLLSTSNKRIVLYFLIIYYTIFMYIWFVHGEWAKIAWVPYSNYLFNYISEGFF